MSQAIAAMMRAQDADPTNLEVLLALGVSHTNGELLYEVKITKILMSNRDIFIPIVPRNDQNRENLVT